MKKYLPLAALLLALPALGQATFSVDFTAGQANRLTRAMNRVNAGTCKYFGFAPGCATVTVRREFCRKNGNGGQPILDENGNQTGTTAPVQNCPGAEQFIIYSDLASFTKREMLRLSAESYAQAEAAEDAAAAKAAWDAKTQAAKDALCPSFGLTAPCTPF